ncbi:MAG: hypothetical protein IIB56_10490 [Planctomycetes bacterium]|nr:hypothetical protein [Planctomycetota bacterium]
MMRGIVEDIEKAEVKRDNELAQAAESLEQITNGMDEWIGQQREKFKHTTTAFRKKWISRWFSDFFIMELFKDTVHKRQFGDIIDTFRLYMPDIAESLKEIWNNFLQCTKFMRQIQNDKNRVEDNHDLGFWCINFFETAAIPTVESLRHLAERTKEYLAAPKQAETLEKCPQEELNRQVGKLLRSSPPDISASEIARILNENYVGEYKPTNPCAVGKTQNWKKHRVKKQSRRKK